MAKRGYGTWRDGILKPTEDSEIEIETSPKRALALAINDLATMAARYKLGLERHYEKTRDLMIYAELNKVNRAGEAATNIIKQVLERAPEDLGLHGKDDSDD